MQRPQLSQIILVNFASKFPTPGDARFNKFKELNSSPLQNNSESECLTVADVRSEASACNKIKRMGGMLYRLKIS